jgi:hypothetical protein
VRAFALLAAAAAIVTAGCASAGASTNGGAAAVTPANAVQFLAADTHLASSKWHGLGNVLLAQLPAGARRLADGREIDVAVLPSHKTVAFVKGDVKARHARAFGDWTAIADDEAALHEVAKAKKHLTDLPLYAEAMDALPRNALVRVYGSSDRSLDLFAAIPGQLESRLLPSGARYRFSHKAVMRTAVNVGVLESRWLAASVTPHGDGLKLEALAPHGELLANGPPRLAIQPIEPYTSGLADEIPAGVLGVVDFQVPNGAFELMSAVPEQIRRLFGADTALPNELDGVLGGETALVVRRGSSSPEVTLITQPADTEQAMQTLDSLVRSSPVLSKVKLFRAVIGGQLVVSTAQAGIDAFRSGGAKLSADPAFLDAKKRSGMPDRTTAFTYATAAALPILRAAGVPIPKNLPALQTYVGYGAEVQGRSTLTALLEVG